MNISPSSFVTIDELLADVLKLVNDSGFKKHSRGYYISQAQQALEELSFDTYFQEKNSSHDIPENLRVEMPKGAFNLKELYLFNGDECNIENSAVVYYKRNFINSKTGNGYVARDTYRNERDPFHTKRGNRFNQRAGINNGQQERFNTGNGLRNEVYYYGIQNGLIMLSSSCSKFEKIMMVYNGTGCDIGEAPIIPSYLRQAVKDYVTVKALESILAIDDEKFNKWSALYNIHSTNLNKPYDGSWAKAEHRVKSLDRKQRQDIKEYMSKLDY